jgi:HEPN domain-containing protein
MDNDKFVLPWIDKAKNDMATAQYIAKNMYPVPFEIVCFHCQQAAEKYLKGFLVFNDYEPPKIHDLVELAKLCGNYDAKYLQIIPKCEFLTPFAAHVRYPSSIDPEENDMSLALTYTIELIDFIKSTMQEFFNES